ncbi:MULTISPECIES: putative 2-aminoethylphosphonate ABC transporter permease subunit [unclassified Polaromonas]|uniref:putative 2-aminoethylphosphonate ABC transporter permease subunit n=1 Tax=unclassified Polaromonas TaxID=2638319 RepID=UPI000F08585F|nr:MULTISPECIES: putative 2-aminoethylphosphonate ABC transporter permease subunit [unclassified Polaromonas]AYQ27883.1 putative 2-aminoethylphosphonate ABC transporter permease subunit [Polaromonas sp. SP1]QGJ17256.1 putative 2-aminoethylphosphonate ABC transporter permease subunit [Polaromonas sp. Pch-P]
MPVFTAPAPAAVRQKTHWIDHLAYAALALVAIILIAFLATPLLAILQQALLGKSGDFVWFDNFIEYAKTPALLESLWNSLWVSTAVTLIAVPLAFGFAYALTRSCMQYKALFRGITLIPLLAPSLLSAISLIYWFGNQGVLKSWMQGLGIEQIYGAPGIVVAECFAVFPHALMILVTALGLSDARLYEAANAMGTSARRKFFTITLPGAKYGLISAALVTFTLVMTDFGIPKVIGGNFNVLATDVFKLVIGQQDFAKGAVVAILLLAPAVLTFAVDKYVSKRQTAMLTARAVPYRPTPSRGYDWVMTLYCCAIAFLVLAMLGMAVFASFASFWPYNLSPSLRHYTMGLVDAEVGVGFVNSLKMAAGTAFFGTALVFVSAYLLEKTKGMDGLRGFVRMLAMLPMAVPGLVLGLGYIFFFNAPDNPLNGLYHTLTLLTLCTIVHFYTTGHLTAVTALKALDGEFEAVSASLKVPFFKTFWRVTLPICTPALVDIARYFFINAMTTISAVVFLYSPETKVASIAILNLDEAGEIGAAAAMAVLIGLASTVATLLFMALGWWINRRTQAWRGGAR